MKTDHMHNDSHITETDLLLIRCLSGEATEQEREKAFNWINEDKENQIYYNSLRDAWLAAAINIPLDDTEAMQHVWEKIKYRSLKKGPNTDVKEVVKQSVSLYSVYKYAAIAILFMGLGALLFYFSSTPAPVSQNLTYTVEAPLGAKAKVTLPDGTIVNLNAGSKLSYSSLYNIKDRVVFLTGEGFFKVARDKNKPFTVNTSTIMVHALGTSFNVKAYAQDRIVETTLVEGSVKIESNNVENLKRVLKPNEKLTFDKTNNQVEVSEVKSENQNTIEEKRPVRKDVQKLVSIESITSWKDNKLIFENESLEEMIAKMQRWYGVEIHLKSTDSSHAKFSGKFIYNETIYQVLDILSRTTPVRYETKEHKILIYSD